MVCWGSNESVLCKANTLPAVFILLGLPNFLSQLQTFRVLRKVVGFQINTKMRRACPMVCSSLNHFILLIQTIRNRCADHWYRPVRFPGDFSVPAEENKNSSCPALPFHTTFRSDLFSQTLVLASTFWFFSFQKGSQVEKSLEFLLPSLLQDYFFDWLFSSFPLGRSAGNKFLVSSLRLSLCFIPAGSLPGRGFWTDNSFKGIPCSFLGICIFWWEKFCHLYFLFPHK